jgi:hypothetical protein
MPSPFSELAGSPTIRSNIRTGDAEGHRSFLIAWSDYPQFFIDLCGQWQIVGNTPVFISNTNFFPGWPTLIVEEILVGPYGGEQARPDSKSIASLITDTNSYEFAKVDVTYKPLQAQDNNSGTKHPGLPKVPPGTFLELASRIGHTELTLGGATRYWKPTSGPPVTPLSVTETSGQKLATNAFSLRWTRVPAPPWSAMKTAEGQANSAAFLGYDIGCVLFDGADRNASFQINGSDLWTITYQFKTRSQPWNKEYRTDGTPAWTDVVDNLGNNLLTTYTSFSSLFAFGS